MRGPCGAPPVHPDAHRRRAARKQLPHWPPMTSAGWWAQLPSLPHRQPRMSTHSPIRLPCVLATEAIGPDDGVQEVQATHDLKPEGLGHGVGVRVVNHRYRSQVRRSDYGCRLTDMEG